MKARMKIRIVILVVRVIGKIGQRNRRFLRTTVLKENKQNIDTDWLFSQAYFFLILLKFIFSCPLSFVINKALYKKFIVS